MTTKRKVTQFDVARRANVSRSVVSLVINGRDTGRIPEATRRRVLEAVRELGYSPNLAARMLVKQTNRLIGVFTYERFFPYESDSFFYPFVLGIEREASRQGYNLLLFTRNDGEKSRGIYRDEGNILGMVDGAILMGSHPDHDEIRKLVAEGRPFVYIGRREIPGCAFDWVASDYRGAGREVTQHLIQLGHRRIGFIGTEEKRETHVHDRLAGCQEAVDATPGATLTVLPSRLARDGQQLAHALDEAQITALVCRSNLLLGAVGRQLTSLGRRVPEDLSLASLTDDHARLPWDLQPTGIRLNRTEVGMEAVRLLISRLNGEHEEPRNVLVPCQLVVGETARGVQTT